MREREISDTELFKYPLKLRRAKHFLNSNINDN